MCGIVGLFSGHLNGKEKSSAVGSALEIIRYRGPDDTKTIIADDLFAGGAVRLSIEALSEGHQPITLGNITVGFNGEIFNYKSLAKKYHLGQDAEKSEVNFLVHAWRVVGDRIFRDIDGQFAIFIYDSSKCELILARDPYGIRPLFYAYYNNSFYFSSEVKGIFRMASYDFPFDEVGVAEIAMFWTTVGVRTVFEGIKQIKRGNYAVISLNGISQIPYFDEPLLSNVRKKFSSTKDAAEFLRNSLEKSVQSQLPGDVPYAAYLSGGIDSTALTYLLEKNSPNIKIDTFSITFDNQEYDESSAQQIAKTSLGVHQVGVNISSTDIADNFRSVIDHCETVLFRTAPVPLYLLSKKVNEFGYKVIFTGEGADEVLLGYDLFAEARIRRFWARDPNSNVRPHLLRKLYAYLPQFQNSRYFSLVQDFYRNTITNEQSAYYSHLVRWSQFRQVSSYFNFARDLCDLEAEIFNDLENCLPKNFVSASYDRRAQILEYDTLLQGYLLSTQGDRMSMAHSVEARYPFLGKTFVSDMASVDDYVKTSGVKSKHLFRDAMADFLPSGIVRRPKVAYQAPEAKSFLSFSHESNTAKFLVDSLPRIDLIQKAHLESLIRKIKNQYSSERLGFRENMAYIMCQSIANLNEVKKSWSKP